MDSIGFSELLVVGIIALVAVGPERLPHAARELGRLVGRIRRMADELRRALVLEADRMDEAERLKELRKRRAEAMEARQKMAEAHGSQAQPDAHGDAPPVAEVADLEDEAEAPVARAANGGSADTPPGFTDDEWNELPAHIREIVLRRRGEL